MVENKRSVLTTLGDVFAYMAPYAGGTIPATDSPQHANWKRWVALGQEDSAKRGFWGRLLDKVSVNIVANQDYIQLPDNFFKRNGIYVLNVGGDDWNAAHNRAGQRLMVLQHPTTGEWICKLIGFTPTSNDLGELWYFYNPPIPTDEADPLWLDGEMCGFYALKEHFRVARQPGSMDDCRIEYENRYTELLALEVIPTPQEIMSWGSVYTQTKQPTNEMGYYTGNKTRGGY